MIRKKLLHKIRSFVFMPKEDYSLKYSCKKKSLGSGGNGVVKEVQDKDGSVFALKTLLPKAREKKTTKLRFRDEIKTMVKLGKTNTGVIPIIDYSLKEYWYVMPVAEDISTHCNNIDEIVDAIIQIAESLILIHKQGYAHRDIKPKNILYYREHFVLCDFGLVEIPDNPNNLTSSKQRVGAVRTLAPEMSRNPKAADGRKADVYSLAKTLWILLSGNDDSFEGQYSFLDKSMSLHYVEILRGKHLVEIENLLTDSTNNDCTKRPTMEEFCNRLTGWKKIKCDISKMQQSNWNFIKSYLFTASVPNTTSWNKLDEIVNILNKVKSLPIDVHFLFPDRGWMEFEKAKLVSTENDSIDILTNFGTYRMKIKQLILENFDESYWNYFLLELKEAQPIVNTMVSNYEECVCEDKPGNYVSAVDYEYGVYDYDSGIKLPPDAKIIHRCLKGNFLFIPKYGPYNSITSADDGRYASCSHDEFRDYIDNLIKVFALKKIVNDDQWRIMYDAIINNSPRSLHVPKLATRNVVEKHKIYTENDLDFSSITDHLPRVIEGKIIYRFEYHVSNVFTYSDIILRGERKYISINGHIIKCKSDDKSILGIKDRKSAITIFEALESRLKEYYNDSFKHPYLSISILRNSAPSHLFTKKEIMNLMRMADDRHNNVLVIDGDGYANIIEDRTMTKFYPVIHETWCAGNNYVGPYSNLKDLDSAYHYCLGKWYDYLYTGKGQSMDDYDGHDESVMELLTMIQQCST